MTTTSWIMTDAKIAALRAEAGEAGDLAQVRVCDDALEGNDEARRECARVMLEVLPERPTADVLAWIAGTGPDPWK